MARAQVLDCLEAKLTPEAGMGASELFKTLKDGVEVLAKQEVTLALAELTQKYYDLVDQSRGQSDSIRELEEFIANVGDLVEKHAVLWRDGVPDDVYEKLPYCIHCLDKSRLALRMLLEDDFGAGTNTSWNCHNCKLKVVIPDSKRPPGARRRQGSAMTL